MKKWRKKRLFLLILILVIGITVTGCSSFTGVSIKQKGNHSADNMSYSYEYLNGSHEETLYVKEGTKIRIDYNVLVKSGSLSIELVDSKEQAVWSKDFSQNDKDRIELTIQKSGIYHVIVNGNKTKGSFAVKYTEIKS